jgi:16S rRNA (uracil1498-N3)-methyltransferase
MDPHRSRGRDKNSFAFAGRNKGGNTEQDKNRRFGSPGDPALVVKIPLLLNEIFEFNEVVATGLLKRQINPKEAFTIRDANGIFYRASLKELHRNGGVALVYERMKRSPESGVEITLACAVLSRQRMLFVMQKATELGVTTIVPLLTKYAVPPENLAHEKAGAWPGQILRAAKQCRRASLPNLQEPISLPSFVASPEYKTADIRLMLDDVSDPKPLPTEQVGHVLLFVGPEGGFSDSERSALSSTTYPWVLGGRVLRAETAVVVGLTGVQMGWGDYR